MAVIMEGHEFYAITFAVLGITTLYLVDWLFQARSVRRKSTAVTPLYFGGENLT